MTYSRRKFLASSTAASTLAGCASEAPKPPEPAVQTPSYLEDFADLYATDPHAAGVEWFKASKFGLFLHYGLYSNLGGEWQGKQVMNINNVERPVAEWIQFHAQIPIAEYAKLQDDFTAEKFDAEHITDVAVAAGMKYVNITTRHHDSFCLFNTHESDFHSLNSPAQRDLVGELAEACAKKKLGLFLYYSHGRDWKHPHAPTLEWSPSARPGYSEPQPEYIPDSEVDIARYVDFMDRQVTELLTQYGPIAGMWFDGEGVLKQYANNYPGGLDAVVDLMKVRELYAKVVALQPQCLVSYKKGLTLTEDFLTPERTSFGLQDKGKPMEINTTLQAHSWGYNKYTKHRKTADEIIETYDYAGSLPACLLINSGPLGDGSLVPEEEATLREIGQRLRSREAA